MDSQPPISWDPSTIQMVNVASLMLPGQSYSTSIVNFPNTYCIPEFGTTGSFFYTFNVYIDGKKKSEISTPLLNENQVLQIDFDDFLGGEEYASSGIMITEFYHPKTIPVELYVNHVHRKSGTYLSYPAAGFMGDIHYPEVHATQLENTLFWAGIPSADHTEFGLMVVNPYRQPYSYQITLYLGDGERVTSEVLKVSRLSYREHSITELFPNHVDKIRSDGGKAAVCVAAQFKVIAYVTLRNPATNVISTIDHLHSYCLV